MPNKISTQELGYLFLVAQRELYEQDKRTITKYLTDNGVFTENKSDLEKGLQNKSELKKGLWTSTMARSVKYHNLTDAINVNAAKGFDEYLNNVYSHGYGDPTTERSYKSFTSGNTPIFVPQTNGKVPNVEEEDMTMYQIVAMQADLFIKNPNAFHHTLDDVFAKTVELANIYVNYKNGLDKNSKSLPITLKDINKKSVQAAAKELKDEDDIMLVTGNAHLDPDENVRSLANGVKNALATHAETFADITVQASIPQVNKGKSALVLEREQDREDVEKIRQERADQIIAEEKKQAKKLAEQEQRRQEAEREQNERNAKSVEMEQRVADARKKAEEQYDILKDLRQKHHDLGEETEAIENANSIDENERKSQLDKNARDIYENNVKMSQVSVEYFTALVDQQTANATLQELTIATKNYEISNYKKQIAEKQDVIYSLNKESDKKIIDAFKNDIKKINSSINEVKEELDNAQKELQDYNESKQNFTKSLEAEKRQLKRLQDNPQLGVAEKETYDVGTHEIFDIAQTRLNEINALIQRRNQQQNIVDVETKEFNEMEKASQGMVENPKILDDIVKLEETLKADRDKLADLTQQVQNAESDRILYENLLKGRDNLQNPVANDEAKQVDNNIKNIVNEEDNDDLVEDPNANLQMEIEKAAAKLKEREQKVAEYKQLCNSRDALIKQTDLAQKRYDELQAASQGKPENEQILAEMAALKDEIDTCTDARRSLAPLINNFDKEIVAYVNSLENKENLQNEVKDEPIDVIKKEEPKKEPKRENPKEVVKKEEPETDLERAIKVVTKLMDKQNELSKKRTELSELRSKIEEDGKLNDDERKEQLADCDQKLKKCNEEYKQVTNEYNNAFIEQLTIDLSEHDKKIEDLTEEKERRFGYISELKKQLNALGEGNQRVRELINGYIATNERKVGYINDDIAVVQEQRQEIVEGLAYRQSLIKKPEEKIAEQQQIVIAEQQQIVDEPNQNDNQNVKVEQPKQRSAYELSVDYITAKEQLAKLIKERDDFVEAHNIAVSEEIEKDQNDVLVNSPDKAEIEKIKKEKEEKYKKDLSEKYEHIEKQEKRIDAIENEFKQSGLLKLDANKAAVFLRVAKERQYRETMIKIGHYQNMRNHISRTENPLSVYATGFNTVKFDILQRYSDEVKENGVSDKSLAILSELKDLAEFLPGVNPEKKIDYKYGAPKLWRKFNDELSADIANNRGLGVGDNELYDIAMEYAKECGFDVSQMDKSKVVSAYEASFGKDKINGALDFDQKPKVDLALYNSLHKKYASYRDASVIKLNKDRTAKEFETIADTSDELMNGYMDDLMSDTAIYNNENANLNLNQKPKDVANSFIDKYNTQVDKLRETKEVVNEKGVVEQVKSKDGKLEFTREELTTTMSQFAALAKIHNQSGRKPWFYGIRASLGDRSAKDYKKEQEVYDAYKNVLKDMGVSAATIDYLSDPKRNGKLPDSSVIDEELIGTAKYRKGLAEKQEQEKRLNEQKEYQKLAQSKNVSFTNKQDIIDALDGNFDNLSQKDDEEEIYTELKQDFDKNGYGYIPIDVPDDDDEEIDTNKNELNIGNNENKLKRSQTLNKKHNDKENNNYKRALTIAEKLGIKERVEGSKNEQNKSAFNKQIDEKSLNKESLNKSDKEKGKIQ